MALGYLISPALQVEDKDGKPLVGGEIVVFRHGTTTPYITWKNFNGDRNPARVALNALGMAVLLADDSQLYDVYCYDRNGVQQWSRLNVSATTGGEGGGGETDSDLSVLRCDAADLTQSGQFVFDTLSRQGEGAYVDAEGHIRLAKGTWHYDITVEVDYSPLEETGDTTNLVLYTTLNRACLDFDLSYAHTGTLQLSGIVNADDGAMLSVGIGGMATGMTVSVADCGIFEVTGTSTSWEYYEAGAGIEIDGNIIAVDPDEVQGKLTAGTGIDITDDVISVTGTFSQEQADWAQTDSSAVDYIKNKPDLSVYATDAELTAGLATKQDVISDLSTIRSGAAAGATAVQPGSLATVATSGSYNDLSNKPSIPAALSAGDGISIASDVVSAKVDGTTISVNLDGELVALGTGTDTAFLAQYGTTTYQEIAAAVADNRAVFVTGSANALTAVMPMTSFNTNPAMVLFGTLIGSTEQTVKLDQGVWSCNYTDIQADWSETNQLKPSYINNKPIPKTLVAGSNITITEDSSTMTISADAAPQVQANWSETDTSDPSYIQNKPDLDAYATDAELTAGLATKQDVISDIADIRAGASAGATAVQPSDLSSALDPYATKQELNTGLAGKQNTIDDLTQIRQGASLGSTALQPGALDPYALTADVNTALAGKQDTLTAGQNITITNNVISAAADPQVQADWSETDPSEVSYIQNKPDLSVYATNTALTNGLATKQDVISDLATIRSGASAGATAVQPGSLSTVATTGSYTDLTDKPTIPAQLSAGNGISITNNVVTAKVDGTSIDVNSSGELEVIGGSFTQEQADWAETDSSAVSYIENKPVPKTLVAGTNIVITEDSSTITVTATAEPQVNADWNASSGVAKILNKPDLSVYATNTALSNGLATKQNVISDLAAIRSGAAAGSTAVQPGDLATVATSGSYADLSNKPTIPAAQVNSDWNASSGVARILNKPTIPSGTQLVPAATSADADKVLTVNAQGTPAWASAQAPISAGNGINIANNVVSVDTSVVATQTDLAGKEDVFDVGTGLEMDTSGSTPTLQVEAPVDIVAGPGIVIDNPDGNTLRVSTDSDYEVELYSGTKTSNGLASFTLSEYASSFDRIRFYGIGYGNTKVMYECPAPDTSTEALSVCYTYYCRDTDNNPWQMRMGVYTSTNGLDYFIRQAKFLYGGDTALAFGGGNTTQNPPIYRIVGIKRIAGGN